jgi:hypothetical protein
MFVLNLSLPYLDPTDPFFQQVGAELLNEVCYFINFCSSKNKNHILFLRPIILRLCLLILHVIVPFSCNLWSR